MISKTTIITGNHHTPAIEFIHQLKNDPKIKWKIHYISHLHSGDTHIKNSILRLNIKFHHLASGKLNRHRPFSTLIGLPQTIFAFIRSKKLVSSISPHIIVSFGGYVSTPLILAAWLQKIPSITHEQTSTLSLSTKINSLFTTSTALSFPLRQTNPKFVLTGNLLRRQIFTKKTPLFSYSKNKPLIYITGGSQGSQTINQTILAILPQLLAKYTLVHQTGNQNTPPSQPGYHPYPYIDLNYIGWVLNHASLIISRSGANTCQEISTLGKPAILIPLPGTQQNEQLKNALWTKKTNPAPTIIISQSQLTPNLLLKKINTIKKSPQPTILTPKPNLKLLRLTHRLIK